MTILKVRPRKVNTLNKSFNAVIDELLQESRLESPNHFDFVPRANFLEKEKSYEIQLELAGFNKQDVKLHVDEGVLKIEGTRSTTRQETNSRLHVHQIKEGTFGRQFNLPEDADSEHINAKMEDGILTVQIQKDEKRLLKKTISVG